MRSAATVAVTAALTAGLAVAAAPIAFAAEVGAPQVVDYPETETPPGEVLPSVVPSPQPTPSTTPPAQVRSVTASRTLPFTGGELVLVVAAGAGAVGAGGALIAAGRRRGSHGA